MINNKNIDKNPATNKVIITIDDDHNKKINKVISQNMKSQ